jgi:glycosyltransferase involved in cell wall biosynthesis
VKDKERASMRVLLITLRSDMGGGPKHVLDLLQAIKLRGNISLYVASPLDLPFGPIFQEVSEGFIELPHRSFSFTYFLRLIKFCQDNGVQVVHSHGRGAGVYSRLLRFYGLPVVHTYHGIHVENGLLGKFKLFVDMLLERFSDTQIFVSNDEMKSAQKYKLGLRTKSVVINNGIPLPQISQNRSATQLRLGTIARLTHQKGVDNLLQNFASLLKASGKKYELLIAGEGEDRKKLLSLVEDLNLNGNVTFLGEISEPFQFLNTLDVYVSAARWEGLPLSVLEAMASGLPCILSQVPGHHSFIENKAAIGFTSEETFKDIFLTLNEKDMQVLRESAKKYIHENHSHETQVNSTIDVYRSLLPSRL